MAYFRTAAYNIPGRPGAPVDTSLLLLPTVAKILESPPTEEIMLIGDEVANMVWGVEKTIPVATGDSMRGIERQTRVSLEAQLAARLGGPPPAPVPANAPDPLSRHEHRAGKLDPINSVHVDGSNREIQIQRATMPRVPDGMVERCNCRLYGFLV